MDKTPLFFHCSQHSSQKSMFWKTSQATSAPSSQRPIIMSYTSLTSFHIFSEYYWHQIFMILLSLNCYSGSVTWWVRLIVNHSRHFFLRSIFITLAHSSVFYHFSLQHVESDKLYTDVWLLTTITDLWCWSEIFKCSLIRFEKQPLGEFDVLKVKIWDEPLSLI